MRRRICLSAFGVATLLAAPVSAATVEFNLGSLCRVDCDNVNAVEGELFVGTLTLSTASFAAGGPATRDDVVNFSFVFGASGTFIDSVTSAGFSFAGTWGATTEDIGDVSFVVAGSDELMSGGPFISFGPTASFASLQGGCEDVDCARTFVETGTSATLSPLSIRVRADVAPVPLPSAALLIGAGVAALVAAARRRRGRRAAA
jgi:hypothetical protein